MSLSIFNSLPGAILALAFVAASVAIGYAVPGWSGKVAAALLMALPFLAVALMVAIGQGLLEVWFDREFTATASVLRDAGIAAGVGGVLAAIGARLSLKKDVG